jgi:hypothetical protein
VHSAVDLKKMLAEHNLQLSRIACVMGDNMPFNAALAKQLNLPLGKRLPHSLNLVVKTTLKPFKGVHAVCGVLSGIIPAGGSARHRESLKARGLSARLMAVNRIGLPRCCRSLRTTARTLRRIRKWVEEELAPWATSTSMTAATTAKMTVLFATMPTPRTTPRTTMPTLPQPSPSCSPSFRPKT